MGTENWETMDIELWNVVSLGNFVQLNALANLQTAENYYRSFAAGKNNILHIAGKFGSIYCAIFIGNQVSSTTLRNLLIQPNCRGNTPLHCAVLSQHSNLVDFFISKMNGDEIKLKNNKGDTTLHLAVAGESHENLKITRILVEKCPDLGKENNSSKEYPIYIAAERGSLEILQCLLRFRDFPVIGPGGKTALHVALARRNVEIFRYLVENRRELAAQKDDQGSTPLHYVASCGDLEMTRSILNAGSNQQYIAHICDNNGTYPIHVAASQGNVEIIQLILQSRRDSFELVDNSGRNFLHVAVNEGRTKVVKFLIEEGELKYFLINQQDDNGDTPLHLAVRKHDLVMVKLLLKFENLSKVLRNIDGMTALDLMDSELASSPNYQQLSLIGAELIMSGTEFSAKRLDGLKRKFPHAYQDISHLQGTTKNVIIVSVLIATVTFAAGFTIPGGYTSDSGGPNAGFAVLSHVAAFKVFMISNALASTTSLYSTFVLIQSLYFTDEIAISHMIRRGKSLLLISSVGMMVAFSTGTYVVIPPDLKWFAVLVIVLLVLIPIFFRSGLVRINPVFGVTMENYLLYKNLWIFPFRKDLKIGLKWWGYKLSPKLHFFL